MKLPIQQSDSHVPVVVSPEEIVEKRARGEITSAQGLSMLQAYVRKTFPHDRIVQMIDDLCKASDVKMTKMGDVYESPNWIARDKGIDKVLKLLQFDNDKIGQKAPPTKMVFNIISNSPVRVSKEE